jgi:hypothetical protein
VACFGKFSSRSLGRSAEIFGQGFFLKSVKNVTVVILPAGVCGCGACTFF